MNLWEYFWGLVILFSIITFSYMSVKIVFKGLAEMKEMLQNLEK